MATQTKAEQLNIRASAAQKAKLARAASLKNMNVSQFVLHKSLEAADQVLADEMVVTLCAEDYDYFIARLEEPPRDLPALRELLNTPSVLEK